MKYWLYVLFIIIMSPLSVPNVTTVEAKTLKLKFNPMVEGGIPCLNVEFTTPSNGSSNFLILTSYVLDTIEIVLSKETVYSGETIKFELPNRGKKDILGVRVEEINESESKVIKEWRALYQPGKKLVDYTGSNALRNPIDFDQYWKDAKVKLSKVAMNPEITPVPERETKTGRLYKVKLNSYNNIPIICWYFVPKEVDILSGDKISKKYPAIQIMPGYGAEEPPIDRTADGFITLSLNPLNHGPSKEYFKVPVEHYTWNIDKPEEYYYRHAYMDCLRGIDFLMSRPEVDHQRVGVEGGSQGGAFSLAVAALDPRIACAVSNVPYISNFPDFVTLATNGSGQTFGRLMQDPEKGEIITKTLSYIDVSNLTPWIRCPVQISIGLQDRVCPPTNGIVALNRLSPEISRQLIIDPNADHEVTHIMRNANMDWYRKFLIQKD